ncbi:hypothetical protein EVAR_31607_1 [Eumeta japonica]|uniref:Uncharacterized protein n=1 Tax=Eumeta variegata TaxID=151549 RepID=A0A4C1VZC9_EUMVA|nr:hypothetical protein EVAR_31607_1 [Eumeta japonica]
MNFLVVATKLDTFRFEGNALDDYAIVIVGLRNPILLFADKAVLLGTSRRADRRPDGQMRSQLEAPRRDVRGRTGCRSAYFALLFTLVLLDVIHIV